MKHYLKANTLPFWIFHIVCLGVFLVPFHARDLAWAFGLYFVRMFFVTGGYHRYFSHRAYSTSRAFQFILAFGAQTSSQKGALWWAAHHREHHRNSDTEKDIHTPLKGFWWSHFGWFLSDEYAETDLTRIPDMAKYPELVWLDRYWVVPVFLYALALLVFGGLEIFLWGFVVSTVMLWHGTFTINSLSHVWGSKRYDTGDNSLNNPVLAVVTLGEGWHNNHHQFPSASRNGFFWYEYDVTFYILKALSVLGVVWNLKPVPARAYPPKKNSLSPLAYKLD
jgi:stearoyl-CoA desaturase (delta-9 desaturase)